MTSRTGGGGEHRFFKYPSFDVKSDTAGKVFGPGVDLISDDSFVVAPRSRHVSAQYYSWSKGPDPLPLPQKWIEHLEASTKPSRKRKEPSDGLILEGQRNNHLTSLAGKLWRGGISHEVLLAALLAENGAQCSPPLDSEEVEKIAASVTKYAPGVSAENRSDPAEVLMRSVLDQWFAGGKHLMFAPDGQFWEFDVKLWRPVSDAWIKGKILDAVQTGARQTTASLVSQTLALLKAKLATKEDRLGFIAEPPPVINCANGEVWIAKDGSAELRPHNPESFLWHCLNVNYDPDAKSPMYDKALLEIFSAADDAEAMASHWNELAGYIIQPRRNIPLIGILWGRGDNGKTKLNATVIQLLGEQLVCAQPIENFDKNRFAMGSLFGKYLFVDDDVSAGIKLPRMVATAPCSTGGRVSPPRIDQPEMVWLMLPAHLCRYHIGGAAPPRPTLIAGAISDPSGCFCAPMMIIMAPGLRSSLLPGVNATTGVPGGTITFFSPSLYFTTIVLPSTLATFESTLALVMVLPGSRSQGRNPSGTTPRCTSMKICSPIAF
jgi:hypothetical protein